MCPMASARMQIPMKRRKKSDRRRIWHCSCEVRFCVGLSDMACIFQTEICDKILRASSLFVQLAFVDGLLGVVVWPALGLGVGWLDCAFWSWWFGFDFSVRR
jgi:hypothetical protein